MFEDVSPRDGSVIASVARGGSEDIDRAVRAARRSFDDGVWARADPLERKRVPALDGYTALKTTWVAL